MCKCLTQEVNRRERKQSVCDASDVSQSWNWAERNQKWKQGSIYTLTNWETTGLRMKWRLYESQAFTPVFVLFIGLDVLLIITRRLLQFSLEKLNNITVFMLSANFPLCCEINTRAGTLNCGILKLGCDHGCYFTPTSWRLTLLISVKLREEITTIPQRRRNISFSGGRVSPRAFTASSEGLD